MDQVVQNWGVLFGIWITFLAVGSGVFYFLYKDNGEDTHLSA